MFSPLYAEGAQATSSSNPILGFLPIILIFVIFYFFMIRPQQKKYKDLQNMVNNLKIGDKIVTSGGIYGFVDGFKDDQNAIYIKISDNTRILLAKEFISKVIAQ